MPPREVGFDIIGSRQRYSRVSSVLIIVVLAPLSASPGTFFFSLVGSPCRRFGSVGARYS